MYFIDMDMIGCWSFGFISGVIFFYLFVKSVASKNKQQFIKNLKSLQSKQPNDTMIVDAINNNLDQLMQYHGQEVKVCKEYYLVCTINNETIVLPERCLVPIHKKEEC